MYLGTEGDATTRPQRRALAAHPRIPGALLVERLPAAAAYLRPRQRAGRSLMRHKPQSELRRKCQETRPVGGRGGATQCCCGRRASPY